MNGPTVIGLCLLIVLLALPAMVWLLDVDVRTTRRQDRADAARVEAAHRRAGAPRSVPDHPKGRR